jgi:ABC-type glycerol-3-phosphate transport system substrate-binding protein
MKSFARAVMLTTALAGLLAPAAAMAGTVVWWAPNWGKDRAEALVAAFQKENPGIQVKLEITVADGLQNRILIALRSGNPPDLIDVANGWNVPFALTNTLLPLEDVAAREKIDLKDFLPASLSTGTVNGKLYGLPYRAEAHAIIYNKGAYREAGLDPEKPPQTWAELVDVSKKLTRKTASGQQQYGFGITGGGEFGNTIFRSLPFMWMNGGGIISDDMKEVIVNKPESVAAVKFYTDMLVKEKVAPPSTLENDGTALRRLFIAGTVAQYQSGQFDIDSIKKENPKIEIGVAPIPHPEGKQTAAILGGWNFVIPAASKNQAEAGKLLAFLARPENMGAYTDTFPARVSGFALPRFQAPELQAFKAMLPFAKPQPPAANWVQITQIYFNHVQEILIGGADAQKAMDATAAEIKPLLAK